MKQFVITSSIWLSLSAFASVPPLPRVKTLKLQTTEVSETLTYPAQIESAVSATVVAEAEGIIRQLPILGAKVKKGQKLFVIQQLDPVYQYAPVKIMAPVAGVVGEIFVSAGTRVARGDKIAQVTDPQQLKINLEVPTSDIAKIQSGTKGVFKTSQMDQSIDVSVEGISPTVNSTTGTASAVLTFVKSEPYKSVSSGMIGQVQIKIKPEIQILVPEQAVVYKGAQPFLRVVENNIAKFREVTVGQRIAGQIVITKGIKPNELVIERASQYVGDNKPVEIE